MEQIATETNSIFQNKQGRAEKAEQNRTRNVPGANIAMDATF